MTEENTGIKQTKLPTVLWIFFIVIGLIAVVFIVAGMFRQSTVNLGVQTENTPITTTDKQTKVSENSFNVEGKKVSEPLKEEPVSAVDQFKNTRATANQPKPELSPYQKFLIAEKLRVKASYRSGYKSAFKSNSNIPKSRGENKQTSELDELSKRINQKIALLQGSLSSPPEAIGQSDQLSRERNEQLGPKPGQVLISPGTLIEIRPDIKTISSLSGVMWRGKVTRDVYDHERNYVVIPKGSDAIGTSQGITGNTRTSDVGLALVAEAIYLPNNKKIEISIQGIGADGGFIRSDVKHHTFRKISGFVAYALVGNGLALNSNSNNQPFSSNEQNLQNITQDIKSIADQKASDYLDIQPTVYVKPGEVINLMITDNIWSEPYSAIDQTQYTRY